MKFYFFTFFAVFFLSVSIAYAQPAESRMDIFNEICTNVENYFYDLDFLEQKFPAIKKEYKKKITPQLTQQEFTTIVNEMLSKLNVSHTYYLSPDDYEYYHLAAIFSKVPDVQKIFKDHDIEYPTIGIITQEIDGKNFIAEVFTGSIAEKAGLLKGDLIVNVDGKPYHPINSLKNRIGQETIFAVKRTAEEDTMSFTVVPETINPKDEMMQAEKNSIRIIETETAKIGYIHIYSYAGQEFHDELVGAISWGALKNADALIIDLRYGFGGADQRYLNIFNKKIPTISAKGRNGETHLYDPQWRKPAVYIVNNTSRSGKEILAFGAKKFNLATVIGERTAGAVLAGRILVLSNNDLMYLAVTRSMIDGVDLEGTGVEPDIKVPMDIRFCAGQDQQLQKAVEYLEKAVAEKKNE